MDTVFFFHFECRNLKMYVTYRWQESRAHVWNKGITNSVFCWGYGYNRGAASWADHMVALALKKITASHQGWNIKCEIHQGVEPLTCQSDLQLPFQNGEMLQVQQPLERYIWLLVLKSGVPEHALDALRINFEPQVLVEIYNCRQQEWKSGKYK